MSASRAVDPPGMWCAVVPTTSKQDIISSHLPEGEHRSLLEVPLLGTELLAPLGTTVIPKALSQGFALNVTTSWGCFCTLHVVREDTFPAHGWMGPSSVGSQHGTLQGNSEMSQHQEVFGGKFCFPPAPFAKGQEWAIQVPGASRRPQSPQRRHVRSRS